MTTSEVEQLFGQLRFERDDRAPPDERRRGRFKAGWEDATVRGKEYAESTLQWLTWHNLGYRFGRLLGHRSQTEIDEAYKILADLYVRPQASNTGQALRLVPWDVNAAQLPTMQVATWNVKFRDAAVLEYLAQVAAPDVVTLQEVTFKQEDAFRERLAGMGLKEVYYSGRLDAKRIPYGNIIASRWPLDAVELRYPPKQLPWPQALAQVSVTVDGRSIVVITAHIPNAKTYGWHKIDTFVVLNDLVRRAKGKPCIVTGDFNEPQFEMQDGHILTWGQEPDGRGGFSLWPAWEDSSGRTGTGREWDAAVRWVFEKSGLRHAYWEAHGDGTKDVSHVSRGRNCWIDHMFVSDEFQVEKCDYFHQLRGRGFSDHSALCARLTFDGQSSQRTG
jgi:endonuclease/exonuclease/phosphatase family metal-dependent hydrolase